MRIIQLCAIIWDKDWVWSIYCLIDKCKSPQRLNSCGFNEDETFVNIIQQAISGKLPILYWLCLLRIGTGPCSRYNEKSLSSVYLFNYLTLLMKFAKYVFSFQSTEYVYNMTRYLEDTQVGPLLNKVCCYWCLSDSWMETSLHVRPHNRGNFCLTVINDRDYRGLKKCIATIRDSTSPINLSEERLSNTSEDQDLEARAGSDFSLIPAADVTGHTQEQGGNRQLIQRRGSTWTRSSPRIQQAISNLKRPRTWSLLNRRKIRDLVDRTSSDAAY